MLMEIISDSYSDFSLKWMIVYSIWTFMGTMIMLTLILRIILILRPYFFSGLLRFRVKEDEDGQYLLQQKYFLFWYKPEIDGRERRDGEKNILSKQRGGSQFLTKENAIAHIEIMKKDIKCSIEEDKKKRARPKRTVYENKFKR